MNAMNHPYVAILISCGFLLASGCDRGTPPIYSPTQEELARAAVLAEQRAHELKVEQLKTELPKLAALQGLRRTPKAKPILTGKIAALALTPSREPEVAELWWRLPQELRAYTAAEAETVIRVDKTLKVVGKYERSGGDRPARSTFAALTKREEAKAYVQVWTVQIIDARTRTFADKVFVGGMPPQTISGRSYADLPGGVGSDPGSDVSAWILGLPRETGSTPSVTESASPAHHVASRQ